ncbi:MAG: hypothetical protein IKQ97_05765, partial [Eubacterium sp.]|nr:hypothetical protein [Eubacterium sp.]
MRRYQKAMVITALAAVFVLSPFSKGAQAKTVYEPELPENPAIKVEVMIGGRTFEYDNIDDGWKKAGGAEAPVMKLYADWDIKEMIDIGSRYNNLTIDLNGHRIRRVGGGRSETTGVFRINRGGKLIIKDLPSSKGLGKGGVITGGNRK